MLFDPSPRYISSLLRLIRCYKLLNLAAGKVAPELSDMQEFMSQMTDCLVVLLGSKAQKSTKVRELNSEDM